MNRRCRGPAAADSGRVTVRAAPGIRRSNGFEVSSEEQHGNRRSAKRHDRRCTRARKMHRAGEVLYVATDEATVHARTISRIHSSSDPSCAPHTAETLYTSRQLQLFEWSAPRRSTEKSLCTMNDLRETAERRSPSKQRTARCAAGACDRSSSAASPGAMGADQRQRGSGIEATSASARINAKWPNLGDHSLTPRCGAIFPPLFGGVFGHATRRPRAACSSRRASPGPPRLGA